MSWRDDMRPGSFRGVPFHSTSSSGPVGRRVQVNEFPGRNDASTDDLGGMARRFDLTCFVLGADYMIRRDALIAALSVAGPGELIHPWRGSIWATVLEATTEESAEDGGVCRFSISFIEEGARVAANVTVDQTAEAVALAEALTYAAETDFAAGFEVVGKPAWVLAEARAVISAAQTRLEAIGSQLAGRGEPFNALIAQSQTLRTDLLKLASTPGALASSISGMITGVRRLASTPADAYRLLKTMLRFGDDMPIPPRTTPSRTAQAKNQEAIIDLVKQVTASEIVLAATEIDFVAYDDADKVRGELSEALDVLALVAADAGRISPWRSLSDARQAIITDITARGADLARVSTYTPNQTEPAIVIAYRLYGAENLVAREADIIARNRLQHPGFVQAGQPLEVLND